MAASSDGPKVERLPASLRPALDLWTEFTCFAGRRRIAAAIALIMIGTALDGVGILLLVELFQWFLASGSAERTGELPFAWQRTVAGSAPSAQVGMGLAAFGGLVAARCLVQVARDTAVARLQHGFVETIRLRLFERIASASWTSIIKIDHARLVQMLGSEIVQMSAAVHNALQASVAAIMLLGLAAFAIILAPGLALFTFVIAAVLSAGLLHLMRRAVASGRTLLRHDLSMAQTAVHFLHALKLAKAQGLQEPFRQRYAAASGAAARQRTAFARFGSVSSNVVTTATLLAAAAAMAAGTFAFDVAPPALIAFVLVLSRMTSPALVIQKGAQHIAHNVPRFELLRSLDNELEDLPPVAARTIRYPDVPAHAVSIRLHDICFRRMPDCAEGLTDISLTIEAGELVGIAGVSGSGKTTLLDLIAGLIEPDSGTLSVNGQALSGPTLADHRAALSYVDPEPILFVGTLRDNLAWPAPGVTDGEIWQALEVVGASQLVRRNGQGLDTVIAEGTNRFSAGERQRLALASAILRRPGLMLLDEATSSLDAAGESAVIAAIRQLCPRPTMLLVSHRAESLALCERLVTLESGRIVGDDVRGRPLPFALPANLRRML